ncbi:hypothetical protein M513_10623, partial [Trichuris suis]
LVLEVLIIVLIQYIALVKNNGNAHTCYEKLYFLYNVYLNFAAVVAVFVFEMPPPIMPKDAEAMVELLKKIGVEDYEPRVINFLVELAYRSSFSLLEDAHVLAEYSNKDVATAEDVLLAIRLNEEKCSDLRSIVQRYAEEINAVDLPTFKKDFDASTSLSSLDNAMGENYQLRSDLKQLLEEEHSRSAGDAFSELEDVGDAGIPEKRQKLDL